MPTFNFDFNRSVSSIDTTTTRSGIFTPNFPSLDLGDDAIVPRLRPQQPSFSAAIDSLRSEREGYADFHRFRWSEAARLQVSAVDAERERRLAERQRKRRLELPLRRVRDTRQAGGGSPGPVVRVC